MNVSRAVPFVGGGCRQDLHVTCVNVLLYVRFYRVRAVVGRRASVAVAGSSSVLMM